MNCCEYGDSKYTEFLTDEEWIEVESSVLRAMRERLKAKKKAIGKTSNPTLSKRITRINCLLEEITVEIEKLRYE